MASYPSSKTHRPSRRKLGKGQHTQLTPVTATPVAALAVVTITFDRPVVVSGNLSLGIVGNPLLTQVVTSPTVLTQTYTGTVVGDPWTIAANDPAVRSMQGGGLAPASGTF